MGETEKNTREAILEAAMAVFLEKGFREAGLREIAARAGVTTGALYGYFRGKQEVFEALVKPHYDYALAAYRDKLTRFAALPAGEQQARMKEHSVQAALELSGYLYAHRDAFRLLLCRAEGTPYSSLIHELATLDRDATHDFMATTETLGAQPQAVNPALEHMLNIGMFSTYFELIVDDVPQEEAGEYIRQMMDFYYAGWMKIMGL